MAFDASTLQRLAADEEVWIETTRPDGTVRRTVIWVIVAGDDVFVRSVRGDRGHWYQAALDRPAEVALVIGGDRVPVAARPAADEASVTTCSRGLELKYRADPSLASMLRPGVLHTTLRLEPR